MQVVRSAVVQQYAASAPEVAATLWPDHPRVALGLAMAEIGAAAGAGKVPAPMTIARSQAAARRAPLAVEPFLIEGAMAQSGQRPDRAERLFVEAARRDPRSAAARFFLAQLYLSSGRPMRGAAPSRGARQVRRGRVRRVGARDRCLCQIARSSSNAAHDVRT